MAEAFFASYYRNKPYARPEKPCWSCYACHYENHMWRLHCRRCNTLSHLAEPVQCDQHTHSMGLKHGTDLHCATCIQRHAGKLELEHLKKAATSSSVTADQFKYICENLSPCALQELCEPPYPSCWYNVCQADMIHAHTLGKEETATGYSMYMCRQYFPNQGREQHHAKERIFRELHGDKMTDYTRLWLQRHQEKMRLVLHQLLDNFLMK